MKTVEWKIHFTTSLEIVYSYLVSQDGREKFWSETSIEKDGFIFFTYPNESFYKSKIILKIEHEKFYLEYFDSLVKFHLVRSEKNGTELTLINEGISEKNYLDAHSGWVSVLLNMKAVVDYNCDLRNHNENRTWDQKYVDN